MDWSHYTSLIGYLIVVYILFQFVCFTWTMFRWYGLTLLGYVKDLRKYGDWVIVTGATDGIGKEYARQFAKQGFKIVLISRRQEKLEQVSKEIEVEYGVETKFICFDFTQTNGYDKIEEIIGGLDVGILVNNVGTVKIYEDFFSSDIDHAYNILHCNVFSDVHMTHMILKGMVIRKRGAIIHISSMAQYTDFGYSLYSSTKGFLGKFCKTMQLEGSGIDHQLVTPGYVSTKLSKKKPAFGIPTAEDYVKCAIRTIGIAHVTCGYLIHEIQCLTIPLIPNFLLRYLAKKTRHAAQKDSASKKVS